MKKRVTQLMPIILLCFLFSNCSKEESETIFSECVEPTFDVALGGQLEYIFTATFSSRNNVVYTWILDNVPQEEDGATTDDIPDNTFSKILAAGTHNVCIRIEDDCTGNRLFCREIAASVTCETLSFNREGTRLIADFNGVNSYPEFIWTIDGVEKKVDGVIVNGNNKYDLTDLALGTYMVCIKTPSCDSTTEFCSEVIITESAKECSSLTFVREGNLLKANFADIATLETYAWYVDNVEIDVEEGVNRDNVFDVSALADGTYNICIKSSVCDAASIFCEIIEVKTYECRKLFFEVHGDKLIANFPGIEVEQSYDWSVNGKIVKKDGLGNNGNNQFDLTTLDDGTYEICILTEDCDPEFEFCDKSLPVGDPNNPVCPKLSYSRSGNELVANFTGIDNHSLYKWVVEDGPQKDDGISVNGNNRFDLTPLTQGEHKICIYSPGCSVGNYFCDRVVMY